MPPPRPASGDTIYIIHASGSVTNSMSMLACQYNSLVTLTFDLLILKVVSESRVTYVGYLCANFGLPRPFCSRLRPAVRDRQTDVRQTEIRQHHRLMPPPSWRPGHNNSASRGQIYYKILIGNRI